MSGCCRTIARAWSSALRHLRGVYTKLRMPAGLIDAYTAPPESPDDCIFAKTTTCVSAAVRRVRDYTRS